MPDKSSHIETDKRIRSVVEWILDDWSSTDIINNIILKWQVSDRQAKRYISDARKRYILNDAETIDVKRRQKIATLKNLKRSLKTEFKGTPGGIRSILVVEKEINGAPIKSETTHKVVFENYAE